MAVSSVSAQFRHPAPLQEFCRRGRNFRLRNFNPGRASAAFPLPKGGDAQFIAGPMVHSRRGFPTGPELISLDTIRARQPKQLLRHDPFRAVPPEDLTPVDLEQLASNEVVVNPAKVLKVYKNHASQGVPDVAVLIRAFTQLGFLFDPNSFFSSSDRQLLRSHKDFKCLAHDLTKLKNDVPDAAAPVLLYAMACLEYRCAPLLPRLLDVVEKNLLVWRTDSLSSILHSLATLGLGHVGRNHPLVLDDQDGNSRDFSHLCASVASELGRRATVEGEGSLHDWSRAAYSMVMADLYDVKAQTAGGKEGIPALPLVVARACEQVQEQNDLDNSGWAQFFLYQTIYCTDVERPACEEAIKRAVPMWMQERLHQRWLNDIVLLAQPQGSDMMQRDVDAALRRTNTQALLNCSFGRDWDEQHCWFAGFMIEPKIALECDSMLPLTVGNPRPSGWLALKSRLLRKMGFRVVTLHSCFWDKLTEDQKDEQILRLCVQVGYKHNKSLEKQQRKIRQAAHTYKGIEPKKKEWKPLPPPES